MVKLDNPGDWTIRTANSQTNQFIGGYAVLSYGGTTSQSCRPPTNGLPGLCGKRVFTAPPSNQPKFGFAGNLVSDQIVMLDPLGLAPFPPVPPISASDRTILWDMSQPNDRVWKIDDEPFLAWRDDQEPAIVDVQASLDAGVAVSIDNGTVVDIVINVPGGQPTHVSSQKSNSESYTLMLRIDRFSRFTNMKQNSGCEWFLPYRRQARG